MNNYKISMNKSWKDVEINGDVKDVPMDWQVLRFDHFSSISRGGSPRPIEQYLTKNNCETPWVKISDATKVSKYIKFTENFIIKSGEKRSRVVYPGDLIVSNSATPGIPRFMEIKACIHDGWLLLRDFKGVDKNFLFFLVNLVREKLKSKGNGSIFTNLSIDVLSNFESLIPPIKNQVYIADILSHQESIINDMETLIEKYETRQRYLSEELLSGRLRVKEVDGKTVFYKNKEWKEVEINGEIKEIPVDWEVDKVCNFTSLIKGASIPEKLTNYKGNGLMYLKTTEFWLDSASKRVTSYAVSGYTDDQVKNKDEYVISFDGFNKDVGKGTVGLVSCEGEGIVSTSFHKVKNNSHYHFSVNCLKLNSSQKFIVNNAEGSIALHAGKYFKFLEAAVPTNKTQMEEISKQLEPMHYLIRSQKELLEKEKKKFNFLLNNLLSGNYLVEDIA